MLTLGWWVHCFASFLHSLGSWLVGSWVGGFTSWWVVGFVSSWVGGFLGWWVHCLNLLVLFAAMIVIGAPFSCLLSAIVLFWGIRKQDVVCIGFLLWTMVLITLNTNLRLCCLTPVHIKWLIQEKERKVHLETYFPSKTLILVVVVSLGMWKAVTLPYRLQ